MLFLFIYLFIYLFVLLCLNDNYTYVLIVSVNYLIIYKNNIYILHFFSLK